jgi:carboxylesterase
VCSPRIRPGCEAFAFEGGHLGVLMVHGLTGSPGSMRPIGEWLADKGLSVEGVRLPGHGTDVEDLRARRWTEWVDEAGRALAALHERCSTVVAFGQSMGAAVVLALAASRPGEVDGIALANPYVFDARLLAVPVFRHVLRNWKAVANDIATPGVDENADAVTPVSSLAEMRAMLKIVRFRLPEIRQPVVIFLSATDHVAPRSNPRKLLERLGSERTEVVRCPRSYHVVTLDHDAPLVRERLLAFTREVGGEKG